MGDVPREGGSTTRPVLFNGDNYSFWKARMRVFLRSIDEEVWESVVNGWTCPKHVVNGVLVAKPRSLWTKEEKDLCNWNNKANNAIHSAITPSEFRRISNCETAKEAWDTLMVTYEGTSQVKNAKLQVLVTQFEECKMDENDVFEDFYGRLIEIVNMRHNLGDTVSDSQVIRKIMRSLPERFTPKIVSIEDTKEIDSMILSEFLGSIKTFEHNHCKVSKNGKGIALKTIANDFEKHLKIDDCTEEEMALFVKNFRKFIQHKRGNVSNDSSSVNRENASNSNVFQRNDKNVANFKSKNFQQIQCHECKGYGHIASKCANTLEKAKNKGLKVTWDDSDNEENGDGENEPDDWNFTAFVSSCKSDDDLVCENSEYELSDDELDIDFNEDSENNYDKEFIALMRDYATKRKENSRFLLRILELEKEVKFLKTSLGECEKKAEFQKTEFLEKLNIAQTRFLSCEKLRKELEGKLIVLASELENYKKMSVQFTNGSEGLNKLLGLGKSFNDRTGLGFVENSDDASSSQNIFVKPAAKIDSPKVIHENQTSKVFNGKKPVFDARKVTGNKIFSNFSLHPPTHRFIPVCHHCGVKGHIRPRCFKLGNLNANLKMNLANKIDMLLCEVDRLRKPQTKRFSVDLNDTKRMANNSMWVRKDRSNFENTPISKSNDFSGFKILKRGEGFQKF